MKNCKEVKSIKSCFSWNEVVQLLGNYCAKILWSVKAGIHDFGSLRTPNHGEMVNGKRQEIRNQRETYWGEKLLALSAWKQKFIQCSSCMLLKDKHSVYPAKSWDFAWLLSTTVQNSTICESSTQQPNRVLVWKTDYRTHKGKNKQLSSLQTHPKN